MYLCNLQEYLCSCRLTAVIHDLLQLIYDADVDNDSPVDYILQNTTATQLLQPLPGESIPVSIFCHYTELTRILSRMLAELYTSTPRLTAAAAPIRPSSWIRTCEYRRLT